jgi:hypothetical protein
LRQGRGGHRVGAKVRIAAELQLSRQDHHLGRQHGNLPRHVDRPLTRGLDSATRSDRGDKSEKGERVELDQLFTAKTDRLGKSVCGRGAAPSAYRAQRNLLQQRRRHGDHRSGGGATGRRRLVG